MDTKHTHSPCCSPAASKAHAHSDHDGHKHDHAAHSHADDHDHGVLPGWPRIGAALVMALLAEASHWLAPQIPALEYAGMALAVVAIACRAWACTKRGSKAWLTCNWAFMH